MGLIYRPRQPRNFNHKPIYWDPKKEQLQRRIEQIRRELEAAEGSDTEAHTDSSTACDDTDRARKEQVEADYGSGEAFRESLSESLYGGTRHLKKQRDKGIDNYARSGIILRSILTLILLGFIVWVLYYRQGPLFSFL